MSGIATREDLHRVILSHATEITALGVRRLGLFGSFVRDAAEADSDVDLLVEFAPEAKTFDNFMQLAFLLEDALDQSV